MLFLPCRQHPVTATALTVVLLVCLLGVAGAAVRSIQVSKPRTFGYMIGDVFQQRIQIELDDPWTLDTESLPANGRIGIWLERRITRYEQRRIAKGIRYQLELQYQIFNVGNKTVDIFTPRLELRSVNAEKQIPVFIQATGVSVAPVTTNDSHQVLNYLELQPPVKPPLINTAIACTLLAAGCAGLLFSLTVFGYIFGKLPGVRRTQGPFARALGRLGALQKTCPDAETYRRALRHVHQAFNETAGRVVMADDLEQFFFEQPRHAALHEPIERLFHHSRRVFFESDGAALASDFSNIVELCRQCRDIERGLC